MNTESQFHVWLYKERYWTKGSKPRVIGGAYGEPVEAVEAAENTLNRFGVPGQSYCEIRFNGDEKPHSLVFLLEEDRKGILNTDTARWPVWYPPEDVNGEMLGDFPFDKDEEERERWEKLDQGNLNLDEIEGDEEDDDGDEGTEDDEIPEDDESQDDGDEDEEAQRDSEGSEDEDQEGDEEDEVEMPRLKIFAKLRGPKGWRKRAEVEELYDRNVFGMKLGIVNDEGDTTAQQEREVFAEVRFVESDETRTHGKLMLKLPTADLDKLAQAASYPSKAGWVEIPIPYRNEE